MKKVFSVLTVAVLAVSTVFAGFSGSASIGVGANFDNGNFGFLDQANGVNVDIELSTLDGEAAGEGDVYATIKGSMTAWLLREKAGNESVDHKSDYGYVPALNAEISEATVGGKNWSVSILGLPNAPDYAMSAIDSKRFDNEDDWGRPLSGKYALPYTFHAPYAKTNGVTVNVFDYKVGLGLLGDYSKDNTKVNFSAFVETPEYDFNGFTAQVGATYAYNQFNTLEDGVPTIQDPTKFKETNAMGISAKLGYANEDLKLSASAATDVGVDFTAEKDNVAADVAANFTYDFVSVDAYYATNASVWNLGNDPVENLLSAQVALDFNSFNVPVALTFAAKDLVNVQDLSAKVDVTAIEGLKLTAKGGYAIETKKWNTGVEAEYENDMLKAKAGLGVASVAEKDAAVILNASASVESSAIIDGAKLKLAWSDANDLLDKDAEKSNYGKIIASCEIKF